MVNTVFYCSSDHPSISASFQLLNLNSFYFLETLHRHQSIREDWFWIVNGEISLTQQ